MKKVMSKDGTSIAFDQIGHGPVIILVDGAFGSRTFGPSVNLAPLLSEDFTVIHYDRRGRGESGDTQPFSKHREIEDIEAIIDSLGSSVYLYGISSGAILAAEAASELGESKVSKLALYEPSFILDTSHAPLPSDYMEQLKVMLSENRREDMVTLFMVDAIGMPIEMVEGMKQSPFWPAMESIAHTLIYDGAFMVDNQRAKPITDTARNMLEAIIVPTAVINGSMTYPFLVHTADIMAKTIPNAERFTIEGQQHDVAADAIAPILTDFFNK